MTRVVATKVVRGRKLRLGLSTSARVTVTNFYGNISCATRSFLDRVELTFTPHDDKEFEYTIPINAKRGVLYGLFPNADDIRRFRTMEIRADRQDDGTYKAVLYRDTDGSFAYYYDHRTVDSEYSDLAEGGD